MEVRRLWVALIGLVLLGLFLAVSAVLARVFSLDGAERSAITALVTDEAAGTESAAISQIHACARRPACRMSVAADVAALSHPGAVAIIQIQPSAGFSLGSTVGTSRVAWRVGFSLPIVQCVRVRRAGDAIGGFQVQLLAITARLEPSDRPCPARF
jgi:hypothetical protein